MHSKDCFVHLYLVLFALVVYVRVLHYNDNYLPQQKAVCAQRKEIENVSDNSGLFLFVTRCTSAFFFVTMNRIQLQKKKTKRNTDKMDILSAHLSFYWHVCVCV